MKLMRVFFLGFFVPPHFAFFLFTFETTTEQSRPILGLILVFWFPPLRNYSHCGYIWLWVDSFFLRFSFQTPTHSLDFFFFFKEIWTMHDFALIWIWSLHSFLGGLDQRIQIFWNVTLYNIKQDSVEELFCSVAGRWFWGTGTFFLFDSGHRPGFFFFLFDLKSKTNWVLFTLMKSFNRLYLVVLPQEMKTVTLPGALLCVCVYLIQQYVILCLNICHEVTE